MKKLIKESKEISYQVILTNNKHSYIKLRNGFLEIHLSKNMALDKVVNKINSNFYDYYRKITPVFEDEFYLWGNKYNVVFKNGDFSYQINNNEIIIVKTANFDYKSEIYKIELKKFIEEIKEDVIKILNKNNIRWVNIKYKKLKSKYGSYQTKKHYITLNTMLASLKKEYAYYVLMHEFAHQKVANHQKQFYDLLLKLHPNYRIIEKKLRKMVIHF